MPLFQPLERTQEISTLTLNYFTSMRKTAHVACCQGQKGFHVSQQPLLLSRWLSGSRQPWSGCDASSDSCYQTPSWHKWTWLRCWIRLPSSDFVSSDICVCNLWSKLLTHWPIIQNLSFLLQTKTFHCRTSRYYTKEPTWKISF